MNGYLIEAEWEKGLMNEITAGNHLAFTRLYNVYFEKLFETACKVLRSPEDAFDIVHDVFLSIWNRREDLRDIESLGGYLHRSIRNRCINHIRKNIHKRDYLATLNETSVFFKTTPSDEALKIKELETVVHKAVEEMPAKMQNVYKLSRQNHLTHKQIADHLGISPETVKKHIQNALEIIRLAFRDYGLQCAITILLIK